MQCKTHRSITARAPSGVRSDRATASTVHLLSAIDSADGLKQPHLKVVFKAVPSGICHLAAPHIDRIRFQNITCMTSANAAKSPARVSQSAMHGGSGGGQLAIPLRGMLLALVANQTTSNTIALVVYTCQASNCVCGT